MKNFDKVRKIYYRTAVRFCFQVDADDVAQIGVLKDLMGLKRPIKYVISDFSKARRDRDKTFIPMEDAHETLLEPTIDSQIYLEKLLSVIDAKSRDMVVMHLTSTTYDEIAATFKVSRFTAKRMIDSGLKKIKEYALSSENCWKNG